MERILIIDDDVALCELVAEYLEPLGFQIEAVHRGDAGAQRALESEHDLILLDVMLPGQNGFEVLRHIRESSKVPVLMLTARGDDVDRIVGLEIGADDYLPKPFNPRELAARVRAILRRSGGREGLENSQTLVVGDVEMEPGTRLVRR
jgi:DNA-binding response OmpR family regulator